MRLYQEINTTVPHGVVMSIKKQNHYYGKMSLIAVLAAILVSSFVFATQVIHQAKAQDLGQMGQQAGQKVKEKAGEYLGGNQTGNQTGNSSALGGLAEKAKSALGQ
jgi:hypothetical protein